MAKWEAAPVVNAGAAPKWQAAPVVAPQAAPADAAKPTDNYLQQSLSGINEGIANALGAPVQLTTDALNLASTGINKVTGMNLPQIEHPVGGVDTFRGLLSSTISPESSDPGQQMARRISQEVGATLIPGMKPVAMAERPAAVAAQELAASLGSGTGAAIAEQVAPGNPYAELAGQVMGGMTPGGVSAALRRPKVAPAPSIDELRTAKNAAYKAAEQTGVAYSQPAYINLLSKIGQEAVADHISPTRHEAAYSFIADMGKRAGQPMSLTELDQLRQEVRRDLITPSYGNQTKAADAHFGEMILDNIDEFISNAKPGDVVSGNGVDAAKSILEARALNTRLRKSETLADAMYKAKLQTESTGSGGNINNAIRQQVKNILTNPKKAKAFNAEERAAMEDLVKQGKVENLLRLVGKLSPSGNGLMAALGIGSTAVNPALAALPVSGLVAKALADRGTRNKTSAVQALVARGAKAPVAPKVSPKVSAALLAGQIANQSEPLRITVHGGR